MIVVVEVVKVVVVDLLGDVIVVVVVGVVGDLGGEPDTRQKCRLMSERREIWWPFGINR